MKIRPLQTKTASNHRLSGGYFSYDGSFLFLEKRSDPRKRNSAGKREWWAYQQQVDGQFYYDTPYFFTSHPTLKSLIKALEKAKP